MIRRVLFAIFITLYFSFLNFSASISSIQAMAPTQTKISIKETVQTQAKMPAQTEISPQTVVPTQIKTPPQGEKMPQTGTSPEMSEDEISEVRISFAGDCTLGTDESFSYTNSFPCRLEKQNFDYSYFFSKVREVFEEDDITIVNLETTFTESSGKENKKFRFRGHPSYVNILKEGRIEMVNISNNHIHDYLKRGYDDTLKTLDNAGILYCGEGYTALYAVNNIVIACMGYTGWDTAVKKTIAEDIRRLRKSAGLVAISFHWGSERSNYPNNVQKELGYFCIDQGADIVVGHHPHVIQGIERYKDRYIVYSLGNFCFGGNRNPQDKDSFIFQNIFRFSERKLVENTGEIIPCRISSVNQVNDYQPVILQGKEKSRVLDRIFSYSAGLKYGIKSQEGLKEPGEFN